MKKKLLSACLVVAIILCFIAYIGKMIKHQPSPTNNTSTNEASFELDDALAQIQNSSFNEAYKNAYISYLKARSEFYDDEIPYAADYAVHYDPLGAIKYLQNLPERNISDSFQLLVLWHIYTPEIVSTETYQKEAAVAHKNMEEYFAGGGWQSLWRKDEYEKYVGNDYHSCYANLQCLLNIIPYWRGFNENIDVYIPCDIAQKYNKVAYFDMAGGGHGAQSFMTSDCYFFPQYQYDSELENYMNMLFNESIADSDGSIRFLYQAQAVYDNLI